MCEGCMSSVNSSSSTCSHYLQLPPGPYYSGGILPAEDSQEACAQVWSVE